MAINVKLFDLDERIILAGMGERMLLIDKERIEQERPKRRRGFATFSPERLREVSSAGGKRSHELGVAHEWGICSSRAARKKGLANRRARKVGAA